MDSLKPAPWPAGQDRWHAYAADLNARMALLQLHIEPAWLFALCTQCGYNLELDRSETIRFRYEVALHRCETAENIAPNVVTPPGEADKTLF